MLPQFGFIVAQAGADSQQPPYYARPYMPQNIYYGDRFYRPPLPPITQPAEWQQYSPWQQPQPIQEPKPVEIVETRSPDEASELSVDEAVFQTQGFNDLMHQMDSEFWEQCDDIFKDRLASLKDELETIQKGTHAAFEETMADIEIKKEQTIEYAEHYKAYELLFAHQQYDMEMRIIEEEYNSEKKLFHDTVLQTIEERRKQLKENKNELGATDLFDATEKKMVQSRKNLRKKTHPYDQPPLRLERRRQNRSKVHYDIHASPTNLEEEELEAEFLRMKGKLPNKSKYKA